MAKLQYYKSPNPNALQLSYSILEDFHTCPRKYQIIHLNKHSTPDLVAQNSYSLGNVDFAYGHCVAAGVQAWFAGLSSNQIFLAMFDAWDIDLTLNQKNKSFVTALQAFDKFISFSQDFDGAELHGWEVARLADGSPAIELNFSVVLTPLQESYEEGFVGEVTGDDRYNGHIDIVLYHPVRKMFRVLEIKTTGFSYVNEAVYGNSDQATGYALITTELAKNYPEASASWDVLYLVYQASQGEWKTFTFVKDPNEKIEFLTSVLLSSEQIQKFREINFFPKRGGNCFKYNRQCALYGTCHMNLLSAPSSQPVEQFDSLSSDSLTWEIPINDLMNSILEGK